MPKYIMSIRLLKAHFLKFCKEINFHLMHSRPAQWVRRLASTINVNVKFTLLLNWLVSLSDYNEIRRHRFLLRSIGLFIATFLLGASFFGLDQVVRAEGQLVTMGNTQIIQAIDGGQLVNLTVKEGDYVRAGDVLGQFEQDRVAATLSEARIRVAALGMTVTRLQAEKNGSELVYDKALQRDFPDLVENQKGLYAEKNRAISNQLKILQKSLDLALDELRINQFLYKSGDISKIEVMKVERQVNDARSAHQMLKNKYLQDVSMELNKAQEDLEVYEQLLTDRQRLLDHTNIIASVSGVIKSIKPRGLYAVLRSGDEILQIVPDEAELIVEAKVRPADISGINVGAPVKVKLDSYGRGAADTLEGKISFVGSDTSIDEVRGSFSPYYKVKVAINPSSIKAGQVISGMLATVYIHTGKRSLLAYLLKPIGKVSVDALGER